MVKERELNDVLQGVLVTGCGSNFQMQKLMMPFVEKIENEFRASGFADALDNPRLPPGKVPHRKPITAEAVVTPIIIGLALFLGSSVGSWAVGRVCDELWDKKIVLGIRKLRERYKRNFERKKDAPLSFIFKFDVYYEHDDLTVEIRAKCSSSEHVKALEQLIPNAERLAEAWIKEKGISSKIVRFNITDAELSPNPHLINEATRDV